MAHKFSEYMTPVTDFKSNAKSILAKAKKSGHPILITQRGRVTAVVESLEAYEEREERYDVLEGVLKALKQAEEGKLHPHKEALKILKSF